MRLSLVAVAAAALAAAGCGPQYTSGTGASLSGKVTLNGQPLEIGRVIFVANTGTASADLATDGSYSVQNVPIGTVKVAVMTRQYEGMFKAAKAAGEKGGGVPGLPPGKFAPVPAKYENPESSGLTATVEKGANTYDIPLTR